MASVALSNDFSGFDIQSCKKRSGTAVGVAMSAGLRMSWLHRKRRFDMAGNRFALGGL
jgi:glycerol kinase